MAEYDEWIKSGKYYLDQEDKDKLESMTEIQREKIIYERYEKFRNLDIKSKLQIEINDEKAKKNELDSPKITDTSNNSVSNELQKPNLHECDFILTRDIIVKNVFKPCIGILKGTFVRLQVNSIYYIGQIVGTRTVNKYKLPGDPVQYCSIGLDIDTCSKFLEGVEVSCISSSPLKIEEFEQFIHNFKIDNFDGLKKKYKAVVDEFNKSLTDKEITQMIENRQRDNPRKVTNTEKKIKLKSQQHDALQKKDKELARKLQTQIEAIEDEERRERKQRFIKEQEELEEKKRMTEEQEKTKRPRLI